MTENVSFMDGTNWTEATWNAYARLLMAKDGYLVGTDSELAVIQNTPAAMNVIVGSGVAWVRGLMYTNSAPKTITISAADATNPRIDTIVLEIDWAANTMAAKVVNGTPAAVPVAPTLTQSASVWQHPLANIAVIVGQTSVIITDITDLRAKLFTNTIAFNIDGGGAVVSASTSVSKGYLEVPFACTIYGYTLVGGPSGSAVVDIHKADYATFPTTTSITASAKPTLSSTTKSTSTTLTAWTTAIAEGDILDFYVDSCSTCTKLAIMLHVYR